jgi:hypothetical protein
MRGQSASRFLGDARSMVAQQFPSRAEIRWPAKAALADKTSQPRFSGIDAKVPSFDPVTFTAQAPRDAAAFSASAAR